MQDNRAGAACALRLGAVDAEFAGGGVDATLMAMAAPVCAFAFNRRKLRRLITRQPHPLRNVLAALKRRQFGAVLLETHLAEHVAGGV